MVVCYVNDAERCVTAVCPSPRLSEIASYCENDCENGFAHHTEHDELQLTMLQSKRMRMKMMT
jgi:hypothetical protein